MRQAGPDGAARPPQLSEQTASLRRLPAEHDRPFRRPARGEHRLGGPEPIAGGGISTMATVHEDDRTPPGRPTAPRRRGASNQPSLAESLIVLVFLAVLSLLGLGLFELMPR